MPKLWTKVVLSVALVQIPLFILATLLYIQEVRTDYLDTVGWQSLTLSQQLQKRVADLSGYSPEMQRTLGLNIDSQSLLNDNIKEGVVHVGVIGLDGTTIASTDLSRLGEIEFEDEITNIYDDSAPLTFIASNTYETLIPVYNAGHPSPVAVIYIGFSRQAVVLKIINTITYASVLYFIFLLLSSILISILLRRFVTQPISELSKAATNLANGNLSTDIPKAYSYEVGVLADSFANMSKSITETLDSIKESEERFSLAMQGANDGLWDWDMKTDEVYYSPRWKSMLGYTEDEVKPQLSEWERLVHPDDKDRVLSEVKNYIKGEKEKFEVEFKMQHKDGQYLDILSRAFAVKDQKGIRNRLVGTHVDITALKQTVDALTNSEDRFRTVSKLSNDFLWEWHLDEGTVNWFGDIDEQLGYEENELPRTLDAWKKIIHPEDIEHVEKSLNKSIEEKSPWYEEYRAITKNGEIQYWIDRGEIRTEKNGKPLVMSGAITDITERKQAEQELIQSEEKNRAWIENSPVCTKILDLDFNLQYMSSSGVEALNIEDITLYYGKPYPLDFYPDDFKAAMAKSLKIAIETNEVTEQEAPVVDVDGNDLWFHSTIIPVKDEFDEIEYLMVISLETTKRKQAEEQLKLSSRVFTDALMGVMITDADKVLIDVNPAFCEITGYSREEVIGKNPSILSSGKQSPEFYQGMWQIINEQGQWQGEMWNRKKEGDIYAELLTISVLKDELGNVANYVGVFTDITRSKRQQEQLSLMAHYDVLTGLPNRALFTDRFTQAIAHSKRMGCDLAVCFLDLDDFKPVNDNYGHEVGDQLLVEVAERITACIREEDTVSRQGGDEFALLLNDLESFSQCEQTLERIHFSLAQPYVIDDHSHKVTASCGITLYPNDDADIDTLLRHADQAMYQAKLAGKHRYHLFNPEHDQRTIQKHNQLEEIEQALVNNEFQLYYQPKVNMVTGEVFGAEALIRWIHPEKGLIPPLDFLPIIDGTELELKVGNWVIREALSQLEIWHKQEIILQVSVNISSHHLLSDTFFDELDTALAKHITVGPQCLQLEILESSALGDLSGITTVIETCQEALGVTVALDDFGTGYSSLTHLRSLPVNTIKLDQSFVRDMIDDPSDLAIIDGIIGLSDSFNRTVIAEGVETTNQGLMLLVMGCKEAQGYGIAKPMPADEFPDWQSNYIPNQEWQVSGNKHRTTKEKKVKLFRLVTQRWKDLFTNNIQSSPEEVELWPIINSQNCPCGEWINRAKQEGLFEENSLKQLEQTHEVLHLIAHSLLLQYQNGDIDAARNDLAEFQTAFDKMNNALGMCE